LGDKIGNRQVVIIDFILIALSFVWLSFSNEVWMLYVFAVAMGINYGAFAAIMSPLVADHFGLNSHGIILGLAMFALNVGGAIGSLVAGRIFDISGSYFWAFIICAILGIIGLALSILLKPTRRHD
jgi:OFA family oxalate/formate antiporter-like MFS transporter